MSDTKKRVPIPGLCWAEKKVGKGSMFCTKAPHKTGQHYHWPSRTAW